MRREAARCDAGHLVILDADDQHSPTDVPKLIAVQQQTDAEIVTRLRSLDVAFERALRRGRPQPWGRS